MSAHCVYAEHRVHECTIYRVQSSGVHTIHRAMFRSEPVGRLSTV